MKLKIKKQICKTKTKKGKCCKKHCEFDSDCCNVHKPKENCAICFNELKTLKKTKKLNCSHKFCNDCIFKWLYIEQKETCPLCRTTITYYEDLQAFEYCNDNKFITNIIYYEYTINHVELIEYIENVMICDYFYDIYKNPHSYNYIHQDEFNNNIYNQTSKINSYYDHIEWGTFISYLKLKPELYTQLILSTVFVYSYYQKFDENNQGITINGKSFIYNYKINLI